MFRAPAAQEALSKVKAGSPVWVYKFDHYSKNVFPKGYPFVKGKIKLQQYQIHIIMSFQVHHTRMNCAIYS